MRKYEIYGSEHPLKIHPLTTLLIAINVGLFILINLFLYEMGYDFLSPGANFWIKIKEDNEYYRLFTSMFLHADIEHLMNNMLVLFAIGGVYEKSEGKFRFLTIYFVGGLLASTASMTYNMKLGEFVSSLGASGAIFSLVGASLAAVVKDRYKLQTISRSRLIFFAFFSIYMGFRDSYTDNVAHISGLAAGFFIGLLLSKSGNRFSLYD